MSMSVEDYQELCLFMGKILILFSLGLGALIGFSIGMAAF